ncbi:lanthionine synthetase LanC family protein [Sorangium sp. So ce1389]|uniref:lanthionine synthetase LanC family protein n=1 Tax=Sorangium sp. So ce1389 TaxID=3133336 RepID=UPI003F5FDA78
MSDQENSLGFALATARRIGEALCASAFWDEEGERCNWMGYADMDAPGGGLTQGWIALHAPLGGGSAGVALFLAELHRQAPDPAVKRTAEGALRRSVRRPMPVGSLVSPLSYFAGSVGIACVAERFAELGLSAGHDRDREQRMREIEAALGSPHPLDVMGGNAGAIPALLSLSRRSGLGRCRDLAGRCGEELCRAAGREGEKRFWSAAAATGHPVHSPPMAGLSHGAAGIALALLELHQHTGDALLLETARGAFAYEDALFSKIEGNWLDVRMPHQTDGGTPTGTFQTAWCHGAPGVALARMRAAQLDPDRAEVHLAAARIAVATTIAALERKLALPRSDATLCHGLAGLSEVALLAAELLGDDRARSAAILAARTLCDRHGATLDWPSGMSTAQTNPTLLLGNAGIGHHLLRLHDPARVPPILILVEPAPTRDEGNA